MQIFTAILVAASTVTAHYTLPSIQNSAAWTAVRQAKNWQDNGFVGDVKSNDIRCNQLYAGNSTVSVAAGGAVTVSIAPNIYHPGPFQSYLAKVPAGQDINTWDPTNAVWFRIYADQPTFGSQLTWPTNGKSTVSVPIPKCIPAGNYLMRNEHIALHVAQSQGAAQFYLSCGQLASLVEEAPSRRTWLRSLVHTVPRTLVS